MAEYRLGDWCGEGGMFADRPGATASRLHLDYDGAVGPYLEALERASRQERDACAEAVYGSLFELARHDDGEAVKTVLGCCPELRAYWGQEDGVTPLGEAIAHKAQRAVRAFLACGFGIEDCAAGTGESALELAPWEEPFVLFLLEQGAEPEFSFLYNRVLEGENIALVRKVIAQAVSLPWAADRPYEKWDSTVSDAAHEAAVSVILEEVSKRQKPDF